MRVGIVAAGGESRRTGLGEYTSKAALRLRDRPLLAHQIKFLRRSEFEGAIVIARREHVGLLASVLTPEDRAFVAFAVSDCSTGWAGEVERALRFVRDEDEVLLASCDNDHGDVVAIPLGARDGFFTFTTWTRADRAPTDGTVLARQAPEHGAYSGCAWTERAAAGFQGDFFSGYASFRGKILKRLLGDVPAVDGRKSLAALLAALAREQTGCAFFYGSSYKDVGDLRALALLDVGESCWSDRRVDLGAGVLMTDGDRVMLTERQDGLGWTVPGGHVDAGETYAQAAARELLEETRLQVDARDLRLLGVYPCTGKTGNPACSVIFHAPHSKRQRGQPMMAAPGEVTAIRHFKRDEVAGLTIPFNLRAAVDDWFSGRELDVRR